MRRTASVLVVTLMAVGCDWLENPTPKSARLVVEGDAGKQVRLITSSKFATAVTENGDTRVSLGTADTVFTTLPIDRTFTIAGDERFFAEVSRLDTDLQALRMQLFLNSAKKFDENGPLLQGLPFRFLYTFNQTVGRVVEVT